MRTSFLGTCPFGYKPSVAVCRILEGGLIAAALGALITPAAHAGDLSKIAPDLTASLRPAPVSGAGKAKFEALRAVGKADAKAEPRFRVLVRLNVPVKGTGMYQMMSVKVGKVGRTFASSNIAVVEATPSQLLALSDDPAVASISPDRALPQWQIWMSTGKPPALKSPDKASPQRLSATAGASI